MPASRGRAGDRRRPDDRARPRLRQRLGRDVERVTRRYLSRPHPTADAADVAARSPNPDSTTTVMVTSFGLSATRCMRGLSRGWGRSEPHLNDPGSASSRHTLSEKSALDFRRPARPTRKPIDASFEGFAKRRPALPGLHRRGRRMVLKSSPLPAPGLLPPPSRMPRSGADSRRQSGWCGRSCRDQMLVSPSIIVTTRCALLRDESVAGSYTARDVAAREQQAERNRQPHLMLLCLSRTNLEWSCGWVGRTGMSHSRVRAGSYEATRSGPLRDGGGWSQQRAGRSFSGQPYGRQPVIGPGPLLERSTARQVSNTSRAT